MSISPIFSFVKGYFAKNTAFFTHFFGFFPYFSSLAKTEAGVDVPKIRVLTVFVAECFQNEDRGGREGFLFAFLIHGNDIKAIRGARLLSTLGGILVGQGESRREGEGVTERRADRHKNGKGALFGKGLEGIVGIKKHAFGAK